MSIRVTLSANAGVAIEIGTARIWVDALHQTSVPGFSTLQDRQVRELWTADAFQRPDAMVYTHCHPDHYSAELTEEAHRRWPGARLFLPEEQLPGQELLSGTAPAAAVGNAALQFFRLPHESAVYRHIPHYGLTISCGGDTVLLPGDCAVAAPELLPWVQGRHYRLALLNFPWATLRKGRDFMEQSLSAEHIVLYHLPFAEDDTEGFRHAAETAAQQLRGAQIHIMDDFRQTLLIP